MKRIKNKNRNRNRGFGMLEVLLAITIIFVLAGVFFNLMTESSLKVKEDSVATRSKAIQAASMAFVTKNAEKIFTSTAGGGWYADGGIVIPIFDGADNPDAMNSIQGEGFLPSGMASVNAYGQTEYLLIKKINPANDPDIVIVSVGGQSIPNGQIQNIAAGIGAGGGFVSDKAPYLSTEITGAYGGWKYDVSDFVVSGKAPSVGHIAINLALSKGGLADYLYRFEVPGNPDANSMFTNLNMNNFNINNVGTMTAEEVNVIQGNFDDVDIKNSLTVDGKIKGDTLEITNNASVGGDVNIGGDTSIGGSLSVTENITAGGTVTGDDFVINDLGGTKVSTGVYTAMIVAPPADIPKPVCPSGLVPQVFASVSSFASIKSGMTTEVFSAFQTIAEHKNATTWTVRLYGTNSQGTLQSCNSSPTCAPFRARVMVFTKCS